MNKKQLIIAAMATVLSVGAANASNITGVTPDANGNFTINPAKFNGTVGYRKYDNFILDEGKKADMVFYRNDSKAKALDTFINLVGGSNKVTVNGIINSVNKDGGYTNGHAIFITPNGMTVGSSGVINVGQLSVITPTSSRFQTFTDEYDAATFTPTQINKVSANKKLGTNGSGHAPIDINGYVFTRNGAHLPGNNVTVSGKLVNGLADSQGAVSSASAAATLFNTLVNTNGTINANAAKTSGNSIVFLDASSKVDVSGNVVNLTNGPTNSTPNVGVALTSGNTMDVTGKVAANGKLSLYNKAGNMSVTGLLDNKNGELALTNGAPAKTATGNMTVGATVHNATGDINITNNSQGTLTKTGSVTADAGKVNIVNEAGGAASISGVTKATAKNVRIVNRGNGLTLAGDVTGGTDVSVRNYGKTSAGAGLTQSGTITAKNGALIDNRSGSANINGNVTSSGNVAIINRENAGALTTGNSSKIQAGNILAIKNKAAGGMDLNGDVVNTGAGTYKGNASTAKHETAINNLAGAMTIDGDVTNTGNMGIINKGTGAMTVNGAVSNTGKLKLANVNGSKFDINGDVTNKSGNLSVYNEKGLLTVNSDVTNNGGYLFAFSRKASSGITTAADSVMSTTGTATSGVNVANLAIKHNGTGTASGANGIDLNGTVTNNSSAGQLAINNYKGNTHVGGEVTAKGNMGIINRAGSGNMNVDATVNADGQLTNIKNVASTGNMTLGGTVNHSHRLNVLANSGKLTLDGAINNTGTTAPTNLDANAPTIGDATYIIARTGATGLETTENFNATSGKGMIWIRNRGANGMTHGGAVSSTSSQAELQNYAGNMVVNGTVAGNKAIILNEGGKLTVKAGALPNVSKSQISNEGTTSASIPDAYKSIFTENLKH